MMDPKELKQLAWQTCITILEDRMRMHKEAMDDAQESANSEEKSSMGDKYETSRAMSHINRDMNAKKMAEVKQELDRLKQLNPSKAGLHVTPGSFIITQSEPVLIACGIGKITIADEALFVISPQSPLGKTLLNHSQGDEIPFNGKTYLIKAIY